MHKIMLKFFGFLKSSAQFMKIVTIFSLLCLILYWIEHLAHFNWSWLNFIKPLLDAFLVAGNYVSDGSIRLFEAVFEYKYGVAFIFFLTIYYIVHAIQIGFEKLEDLYGDGRRFVKKIQENALNKSLAIQHTLEQEQIKNYQIYIAAYRKKKLSHLEANVDMEVETKNLHKFLISKTSINPIKYGEGYLYSFCNFSNIDEILQYFFRVKNSNAPLDYIICVQILPKNIKDEFENMKKLINLNLLNQITTLSDTAWRYQHNETHRYRTIQLGLYKKENSTFEVHEFVPM